MGKVISPFFSNRVLLQCIQNCKKAFPLSSKNHSQDVPLLTPKMQHGALFQPAIPDTNGTVAGPGRRGTLLNKLQL